MKAKLRYLHSPDVEDLQNYTPKEPDNFGILVQAMVGPLDEEGEESFDFVVCTSRWFQENCVKDRYAFGRHHLFLSEYNYDLLYQIIEDTCHRSQGPDWESTATQLGRYGHWEFEDYRNG